jgi:glycosyltransferase involved in cell wall biosynthesis
MARGVPADKVDVIYNWADEEAAAPGGKCDLARFGFPGNFNIVYGGNLGRMQGLDTLIRAAHQAARDVSNLRLLLIGDGMEGPALRALVAELGATNVVIEPGVPRSQIGDVFDAADVLAIHLIDDPLFEITIPQKTQFYMAMGKPILCGVKGEAASFLLESGAGVAVEPGDVPGTASAMIRLARMSREELDAMGARGREAYRCHFAFATAIVATEKALETAVAEAR